MRRKQDEQDVETMSADSDALSAAAREYRGISICRRRHSGTRIGDQQAEGSCSRLQTLVPGAEN